MRSPNLEVLGFFMAHPFLHDYYDPRQIRDIRVQEWTDHLLHHSSSSWRRIHFLDSKYRLVSQVGEQESSWWNPRTWGLKSESVYEKVLSLTEEKRDQIVHVLEYDSCNQLLILYESPKGVSDLGEWVATVLNRKKIQAESYLP